MPGRHAVCAVVLLAVSCVPLYGRSTPVALPEAQSGIAMVYAANICSLELKDAAGLATTWHAPREAWPSSTASNVPNPPHRFAVQPMAPGRYELVALTEGPWQLGRFDDGHAAGLTRCDSATRQAIHGSVDVGEGAVGLVQLPDLDIGFQHLAEFNALAAPLEGWAPLVRTAVEVRRERLLTAIRQRREGFDVYPQCGRSTTAVARGIGAPVHLEDLPAFEAFRDRVLVAVGGRSMHSSGLSGGCLQHRAVSIFISDPSDVGAMVEAAGHWLVTENLQAEIDLVVTPEPQLL